MGTRVAVELEEPLKSMRVQLTTGSCAACVYIAINYTPLSMAYYAYDSTANFLSLGSTVLIYLSKERGCKKELRSVGNFEIRKLR